MKKELVHFREDFESEGNQVACGALLNKVKRKSPSPAKVTCSKCRAELLEDGRIEL